MNITLQRISVKGEITEGHLRIDGFTICDTLENTYSCLAPGDYRVHLIKCRQYARKMPILIPNPSSLIPNSSSLIPNSSSLIPNSCSSCPRKHYVNHNTVMPCFCPMIKPGNGIHSRHDGSILIGHRQCQGLLIHPRKVFASLYARLRMTIQRGNEVTLKIINA